MCAAPMTSLPERWLVLMAPAATRSEALLLVDALRRVGARAVERRGDRVEALFPPPGDPASLVADATSSIRASTSLPDPQLSWEWRSHEEWAAAWRATHPPERVAERLVVAPTGSAWGGGDDDLVIRLDPAVAFGTAEHPTTRACLRILGSIPLEGARIVDIGAGSGILSIAAALLGAGRVLALEADALACAVARENARASGVPRRVEVLERRVTAGDLGRLGRLTGWARRAPFDLVLANLDAAMVLSLLPGLPRLLRAGGSIVLSGVLRMERDAVLAAAVAAGLAVAREERDGGWWTGRLTAGGGRWRGS